MLTKKMSPVAQFLCLFGALIVVGLMLVAFSPPVGPAAGEQTAERTALAQAATQRAEQERAERLGLHWKYASGVDTISQGRVHEAHLKSVNEFELQFPYTEPQRAELTLRTHPRWGKSVILEIERGQFLCYPSDTCHVTVRFDAGRAWEYPANGPADHSTTTLFIEGYADFVATVRKSRKIWIEAPIYQGGEKVFEFDVSGLDW